ncbi:hypothetical protein Vi05172_g1952 [Venturia inaequalis]|nr:hypothetical protein Vi05172_g1952 [Venturia inaequalis]
MRTIPNDYTHYEPIDSTEREIRVLVLHPATSPDDAVICSLVRGSLRMDAPCYEAISYCWGSLDDTRALRVRHLEGSVRLCGKELRDAGGLISAIADDQEESTEIEYQVTQSLYAGLSEFRHHDIPRYLWADAICINQGDVKERSEQVGFMQHVYASATRVLVWLYPPSTESLDSIVALQTVLDLVEAIAWKTNMTLAALISSIEFPGKVANLWRDFPSIPAELQWDNAAMKSSREQQFLRWLLGTSIAKPAAFEDRKTRKNVASGTGREISEPVEFMYDFLCLMKPSTPSPGDHKSRVLHYLNKVNKIFAFDWFSRVWVLQEVGSNANVTICHGGQDFKWKAIQAEVFIQASLIHIPFILWGLGLPLLFVALTGRQERRLLHIELLGLTSGSKYTDDRDRLFALLGLTIELASEKTLPSSIAPNYFKTRRQVFADYTRWSIWQRGSLDILSLVRRVTEYEIPQERLPSWVPNYKERIPILKQTIGPYSSYNASGMWVLQFRDKNRPQQNPFEFEEMACLKGTQVNSVAFTIGCDFVSWDDVNGSQVAPLSAVWQSLKHLLLCSLGQSGSYPGASSDRKMLAERENMLFYRFLRHFFCTAAGEGTCHDGRLVRDYVSSKFAEFSACLFWNTDLRQLRGLGLNWSQEKLIRESVRGNHASRWRSYFPFYLKCSLAQRRLFTTPNQNFGLCPKHAQKGDIVVILDGGKVPYILRERPYPLEMTRSERLRAGPTYRFIGECYVETYMDGSEADKAGTADDDPGGHKYYRKVFKIT